MCITIIIVKRIELENYKLSCLLINWTQAYKLQNHKHVFIKLNLNSIEKSAKLNLEIRQLDQKFRKFSFEEVTHVKSSICRW